MPSLLKTVNSFKPIQRMEQIKSFNHALWINIHFKRKLEHSAFSYHHAVWFFFWWLKEQILMFRLHFKYFLIIGLQYSVKKFACFLFNRVNAVLICSPTSTHEPVIRDSLLAGQIHIIKSDIAVKSLVFFLIAWIFFPVTESNSIITQYIWMWYSLELMLIFQKIYMYHIQL